MSYVAVSELVPGLPGDAQLAGTCSSVAAAACFSSPRPFCAPGTLGFDEVAGRVIFALKSATQIAWIQMRLSCLCKMRFFSFDCWQLLWISGMWPFRPCLFRMSLFQCFVVGIFSAQNPLTALTGSKASKILESMFSVSVPLPELCVLALQTALLHISMLIATSLDSTYWEGTSISFDESCFCPRRLHDQRDKISQRLTLVLWVRARTHVSSWPDVEENHSIEAGNAWSDKNSPRSFPRPNSDQITFCFDSIVL